MYPFEPLRPAWQRLWDAVHARAPWTPTDIVWADDLRQRWADPMCVVSHACGWPVTIELTDAVQVVGAFTMALDGADGHRYRSVLVASDARPLGARTLVETRAAVNSDDSLSGWISLGVAASGEGRGWPGPVRWTGAHLDSARAVRRGDADIASIDALSWAHIQRLYPEAARGLHEIGRGPWIPSPPIVTPLATPAERVADLRSAFAGAMSDSATAATRRDLLLDGFVALDETEYSPLRQLIAPR